MVALPQDSIGLTRELEVAMMHIDFSKDDYNDAISKAFEIIGPRPQSGGAQALSILLASVYDYVGIDENVFRCLAALDTSIRQIGFCLVIGRTMYHRPTNHPRYSDIFDLYRSIRSNQSRLPK
jgi:hypothetical protein